MSGTTPPAPPFRQSVRDALYVARMQIFRMRRSRTFLALCTVHTLVAAGAAWVLTRILLELERAAATALGVPQTDRPGAMLNVLRERGDLTDIVEGLVQDPERARALMDEPVLALASFWMGLGTLPFLAAAAGAEAVSPDLAPRTLRFEAVRTGRLEIVAGRFLAQCLVLAVAALVATSGPFLVAMFAMVKQPPLETFLALLRWWPPLVLWGLPFVGLGVCVSQWTASPQVSRVLALGLSAITWMLFGFASLAELRTDDVGEPWRTLSAIVYEALPQGWMAPLWAPWSEAWRSALVLPAMAMVLVAAGFAVFRRRDL